MSSAALPPGFRFHPTDVELIMYYLKRKVTGRKFPDEAMHAITELNICHYSPWELPGKSRLKSKDREWYFFCQRERKYASGSRSKRATETGFWKATGNDRIVKYDGRTVGMIKTLVFYEGVPPKGKRTDWVIHEYRMEDQHLADAGILQDTFTICKVFEKAGSGPKNGSQYGVFREEDWEDEEACHEKDLSVVSPAIVAHTDCQSCPVVSSTVELGCSSNFTVDEPGPSYAEHGISLSELNANEILPDNIISEDIFSSPIEINSNKNVTSTELARAEQCKDGEDIWIDEYGDLSELLAGVGDIENDLCDNGYWAVEAAEQPANIPIPLQQADLDLFYSFGMYDDESVLPGELEKAAEVRVEEDSRIHSPPASWWAAAAHDEPPPPPPPPPPLMSIPIPYNIWDPYPIHHNHHLVLPEMSRNHNIAAAAANYYMELDDLEEPLYVSKHAASQSKTHPP
ncbi:hypothetical protein DM860_011092 [Cuscuta australis]|uniref:NAC domain-containing protein n=1 Tax=Cuscuta australis TaxID=267555 RepID=A0A328E266_9ASTE|nr:hypothetical protein DM860_011092 [Cuscuta australis]